jgi:hypothetical protein
LVEARHCDPFRILGIHFSDGQHLARVLRPDAAEVSVSFMAKIQSHKNFTRMDDNGLFEGGVGGYSRE